MLARVACRKGLLGLLCALLTWPVIAQQTLRETNQALRYSRYSRISPKIIPISLEENRMLLQMPIEKLEENASLSNYTLSYGVINGYDVPYTDDMLRPLRPEQMKRDTRDHFYFEEEVTLEEGAMTQVPCLRSWITDRGMNISTTWT
ncbi:hypothetical protein [Nitritalea halalkaliphila]|nr:hypothetical protein [Nitritalea halalkaliphila]